MKDDTTSMVGCVAIGVPSVAGTLIAGYASAHFANSNEWEGLNWYVGFIVVFSVIGPFAIGIIAYPCVALYGLVAVLLRSFKK